MVLCIKYSFLNHQQNLFINTLTVKSDTVLSKKLKNNIWKEELKFKSQINK